MITRVMNKDREAVGVYLRSTLVNSIGICSIINKYGLESDELYVYADFWADGEIKYVFSVADGDVTVFSASNEVDVMDIYIYLRDNFIGIRRRLSTSACAIRLKSLTFAAEKQNNNT